MNLFRFVLLPLVLLVSSAHLRADVLIGIANIANLTGLNLEWTGDHNSVYVVPALERSRMGLRDDKLRWIAGVRHRLERGSMASSGFFSGLMVGDLAGDKEYERLGAGGELGYQWAKEYTRISLSAALVVLEAVPEEELKEEPSVALGVTINLRR